MDGGYENAGIREGSCSYDCLSTKSSEKETNQSVTAGKNLCKAASAHFCLRVAGSKSDILLVEHR